MIYLSPSATDRSITFTVPKDLDSYLVACYNATKLTGETPSTFCLRIAKQHAKAWYATQQFEQTTATTRATREAESLATEAFKTS